MKVLGARILVEEEQSITGLEARAKEAKLLIVLDEKNRPRATCGTIIEVGGDPILTELGLHIGVRISYGQLAGEYQFIEGKRYRLLEVQEVKMIL